MAYELVMAKRDANGNPTNQRISVSSTEGGDLRDFFDKHRQKPKQKKKRQAKS